MKQTKTVTGTEYANQESDPIYSTMDIRNINMRKTTHTAQNHDAVTVGAAECLHCPATPHMAGAEDSHSAPDPSGP